MSDNTANNAGGQEPEERDPEFNHWAEQNPAGHWGGKQDPLEKGLTEQALDVAVGTTRDVVDAIRDIKNGLGRFFGL